MKTLFALAAAAIALAPSSALALPYCHKVVNLEANVILDRKEAAFARAEPPDDGGIAHRVWAVKRDSELSSLELNLKLIAIQAGCELLLEYRPAASFPF